MQEGTSGQFHPDSEDIPHHQGERLKVTDRSPEAEQRQALREQLLADCNREIKHGWDISAEFVSAGRVVNQLSYIAEVLQNAGVTECPPGFSLRANTLRLADAHEGSILGGVVKEEGPEGAQMAPWFYVIQDHDRPGEFLAVFADTVYQIPESRRQAFLQIDPTSFETLKDVATNGVRFQRNETVPVRVMQRYAGLLTSEESDN